MNLKKVIVCVFLLFAISSCFALITKERHYHHVQTFNREIKKELGITDDDLKSVITDIYIEAVETTYIKFTVRKEIRPYNIVMEIPLEANYENGMFVYNSYDPYGNQIYGTIRIMADSIAFRMSYMYPKKADSRLLVISKQGEISL